MLMENQDERITIFFLNFFENSNLTRLCWIKLFTVNPGHSEIYDISAMAITITMRSNMH